MDVLKNIIEIYERLRKFKFIIKIEDGTELTLRFFPENFHHLCGFQHLTDLIEICSPGKTKIIVEFDKTSSGSIINAKYYLYKREGSALQGNVTYYTLFLGSDKLTNDLFPATYIVEHSPLYMRNQTTLSCEIFAIHKNKK